MANYDSVYSGQQVDDAIAKSQAIPSAAAINTSVTKTQQIPNAVAITAAVNRASIIPAALGSAGQVLAVDVGEENLEYKTILGPAGFGSPGQYLKTDSYGTGFEWGAGSSGTTLYSHKIMFDAEDPGSNIVYPVRIVILTTNVNVYDTMAHFLDDLFACATSDTSIDKYRCFPITGIGPVENAVGGTFYMGTYNELVMDDNAEIKFHGVLYDTISVGAVDYNLFDSASFKINPLNVSNFSDIRTIYYTGYNP